MRQLILTFAVLCSIASTVLAGPAVTVTLDPKAPGKPVPADFAGLSFETQRMLPDADGKRLFTADNKALISLFKSLGIKSLRIGGNTADRPTVPIPTNADIDALFAFAKATDTQVIYTLRLRDSQPAQIAATAKYLMDHYAGQIRCLAIGNEPNVYAKEYPAYREMMEVFLKAINDPAVAPTAVFCGPSTTPGKSAWARNFAKDFGPSGHLKMITQHAYPGGSANKVTDPKAGRELMLSKEWTAGYQKFYDSFAPAAIENGVGFRLEEANSFFHGGAENVSDTFASTLWALDYLHWWAARGAAGLNLHTGDQVAAGEAMKPCRYATFVSSTDGYIVRPIGYALKAFDLAGGGGGAALPLQIQNDAGANLTAYAMRGQTAGTARIFITLINKEHGEDAPAVTITLAAGAKILGTRQLALSAPDVAEKSAVALGGGSIAGDGTWNGRWQPLPNAGTAGLTLTVPAASAMILELQLEGTP